MSVPKSSIKLRKDGVIYESNVEAAEYYTFELCRAALRDVAKFVKKDFRARFYSHFGRRTGEAGKVLSSKVWASASTKYPRVEIGMKPGAKGFYAFFQEFGAYNPKTKQHIPQLGLFRKTAYENIDTITKIQAQYLSYLNNEQKARQFIREGEMVDE